MATGKDLVDVSTYTAAVHVPKTGEDVSAATLEVPLQSLANRTKYLKTALDVFRGSNSVRIFAFTSCDPAAAWAFSATHLGLWTQNATSGASSLLAPIVLPNGTKITRIIVHLSGGGGHGAQPGVRPSFDLWKTSSSGATSVASGSDTTTWPAYDSAHTIDTGVISVTIDDGNFAYILALTGEAGANAAANVTHIFGVEVLFTPIP